jgi:hypothetical protein
MIESPKIWRYLLFGILEYISLIYTIIKQNFIFKKLMVKKKKKSGSGFRAHRFTFNSEKRQSIITSSGFKHYSGSFKKEVLAILFVLSYFMLAGASNASERSQKTSILPSNSTHQTLQNQLENCTIHLTNKKVQELKPSDVGSDDANYQAWKKSDDKRQLKQRVNELILLENRLKDDANKNKKGPEALPKTASTNVIRIPYLNPEAKVAVVEQFAVKDSNLTKNLKLDPKEEKKNLQRNLRQVIEKAKEARTKK